MVEDRMAELDVLLGHSGRARRTSRPCARCGRHRGHGQKYCAACREDAKKEYNADYHRNHYRRLPPEELSAVRRANVKRRWKPKGRAKRLAEKRSTVDCAKL